LFDLSFDGFRYRLFLAKQKIIYNSLKFINKIQQSQHPKNPNQDKKKHLFQDAFHYQLLIINY